MNSSLRVSYRLGTIFSLLALGLAPLAHTTQRAAAKAPLVGTWRLAEHWNTDSAGVLTHDYGAQPIGYFVHDVTGHFSVQIMRTPPLRAFPAIADTAGLRRLIDGYYAAFGTFKVDDGRTESVYHVEGATVPTIIGTDVRLPYRVSGDSLIIGDRKTWRRVWLRVH